MLSTVRNKNQKHKMDGFFLSHFHNDERDPSEIIHQSYCWYCGLEPAMLSN